MMFQISLMVQIIQAIFLASAIFLRNAITNHKQTPKLLSHQVKDQTFGNLRLLIICLSVLSDLETECMGEWINRKQMTVL